MFCTVPSGFEDIGEMFSIAFVAACLRIYVGTCMHEALSACLMLGVLRMYLA